MYGKVFALHTFQYIEVSKSTENISFKFQLNWVVKKQIQRVTK